MSFSSQGKVFFLCNDKNQTWEQSLWCRNAQPRSFIAYWHESVWVMTQNWKEESIVSICILEITCGGWSFLYTHHILSVMHYPTNIFASGWDPPPGLRSVLSMVRTFTNLLTFTNVYAHKSISLTHTSRKPQNVHRKYFWAILMTSFSDFKIDVNICEPHLSCFMGTSSIVNVFDSFHIWHVFELFLSFCHLFDILTRNLLLKPSQPVIGLFFFVLVFIVLLIVD